MKAFEYTVTTEEGKRHSIRNLGKNFTDPKGTFVPDQVYRRFNVSILEAYEKHGKIIQAELRRLAETYQFNIKPDGEMIYIGPTQVE